jgi:hypothetical protein
MTAVFVLSGTSNCGTPPIASSARTWASIQSGSACAPMTPQRCLQSRGRQTVALPRVMARRPMQVIALRHAIRGVQGQLSSAGQARLRPRVVSPSSLRRSSRNNALRVRSSPPSRAPLLRAVSRDLPRARGRRVTPGFRREQETPYPSASAPPRDPRRPETGVDAPSDRSLLSLPRFFARLFRKISGWPKFAQSFLLVRIAAPIRSRIGSLATSRPSIQAVP